MSNNKISEATVVGYRWRHSAGEKWQYSDTPCGWEHEPLYLHPQPEELADSPSGHELAYAVEKALGNRDGRRDAELDELLAMAMNELNAINKNPPAELAEQQGDALAELVEEIQATANDWTGREAPGAAVVRGFAEKARAALAAAGKQQVGEVAVAEQHVLPLAREVLAAQCRSRLEFASERDIKTGRNDANWPELEIIAHALRHPHYMERPEGGGGSPWKPAAQVGEVQGVDLKWLSGSIGEVAHRLRTYMPHLAEWSDRARDCGIAAKVLEDLAARQPGAQVPVAWFSESGFGGSRFVSEGHAAVESWIATRNSDQDRRGVSERYRQRGPFPLYAAPPAQGIDLGQFRQTLARAVTRARRSDVTSHAGDADNIRKLLTLIDQRDAAPGVGQ